MSRWRMPRRCVIRDTRLESSPGLQPAKAAVPDSARGCRIRPQAAAAESQPILAMRRAAPSLAP